MELSLLAGMSQRHISFLETGRSEPTRFSIARLSLALEMPAAEVDAMLLSAGFSARTSRKGWNDKTRHAVDASIDHVLAGHAPYPAVCVDRIWNLQKANESAQKFFEIIGVSGDSNLLREVMKPGCLRDSIINWDDTTHALYRMLELEIARRPHDEDAHALATELKELDGVYELISKPMTQEPQPVLAIQFNIEGETLDLFSLIATIGMSSDAIFDDLRIETLLPANDITRLWFAKIFC
ncbi:helix-turn-helix transcriptional regulator [Photobacterium sp. OFAV2-7]|nr:helix-turn-helix transcriptional regulator [Photobacterium sp. OFAV2-7]